VEGRIGRLTKSPPQFGQLFWKLFSAQSLQKVHSNVHMRAALLSGAKSNPQHSQLGFNLSIVYSRFFPPVFKLFGGSLC